MSEQLPPIPPNPNAPPVQPLPPPPRKKKKHWVLRIIGVLFMLLILLVLFAPTLADTGFVKSIVVSQVNGNLNGTVDIGGYSAGWLSGINASDVKVYDANKTLVLQLNKFSTSLTLLDAIRGNLDLGDTVVDVDLTKAVIDRDGKLNYAKLAKQVAKTPKEKSGAEKPAAPASSSPLPAVHGKLTINYKGSIYQEGVEQPLITIQPSTAVVTIKDINQAIDDDVMLKYSAAGGPVGSVHLSGNALAVKNSQIDALNAVADEKLELADVDLKALTAVVRILLPDVKLETAGTASGILALKASGADSLTANGEIKVAKFDVAGEPLKGGDRLHIDDISIPLDVSRTLKDGKPYVDVKHADVVLNGGQLGKITVVAAAPQDALIEAAALVPAVAQRALLGVQPKEQLAINGVGNARITADLDVAAFAGQLKNTIALQKGTSLTQGHLSHVTTIVLSRDAARIDTDTKLPDLKGNANGRPVAMSPINVTAGLNAVGGATPDLRDLSLKFTSAFLNANGGGATLSQEKLTGSFDLSKLQAEASQFVDLDALVNPPVLNPAVNAQVQPPHVQLAGTGSFDVGTNGDLLKEGGTAKTAANLALAGINASGIGTLPPVKLDAMNASIAGDLQRGTGDGPFVTGYKNVVVTILSTAGNAPVLDLSASADLTLPIVTAPRFELTKLNVPDLAKVQEQFGAFVPALASMGINITGGQIAASTAGSFDGKTITLSKPFALSASNVTVSTTDPNTKATTTVLSNETVQVNANGSFGLPNDNSGGSAKLSDLSVTSSSGLFSVAKAPSADFTVALPHGASGSGVKGNGGIVVSANLKKFIDLAQKLAPSTQPATAQLQSGKLDGTLTLSHGDKPQTDIAFDGKVTALSVTTAQKPIENETISIALRAASRDDFTGMSANAAIESRFATARVLNAAVQLGTKDKPLGMLDMLQHADLDVNVPDLPAVYNLLQAISPPAATAFSGWPEGPLLADARLEAGPILLAALDAPDPTNPNETPEETARRHKREKAERAARQVANPKPADDTPAVAIPPLQVLSGAAIVKAAVNRDAASRTTTLSVSDMHVKNLALQRSDAIRYVFQRDITFKLAAAVVSSGDPKQTLTQQLQQVQVSQLDGDLGVAKLSMPQAITLANLSDPTKMDVRGTIHLDGTLADATPLLAVLQGADKKLPYGGTYAVEQALGTGAIAQGKLIRLSGSVGVTNFQVVGDSDQVLYTEPTVAVKNDMDYVIGKTDPTTQKKDFDQAIIRAVTVTMPQSRALAINFSGRLIDPMVRRVIKGAGGAETAQLAVAYDLEKIWPIIKPMLAADVQEKYKDLKVVGKQQENFTVSGAFPAAKTTAQSMSHLNADGGLALALLDLPQGLNINKFNLPFTMRNGVLTTLAGAAQQSAPQIPAADGSMPVVGKTAVANEGAVDLSEIKIDFSQTAMPITIAKNHKLLQGIRLNPVLANALGGANVVFKNAAAASGLVDVTVLDCNDVPIGDLLANRPGSHASIQYSISDLAIDGAGPSLLSTGLGLGGQGIHGGIKNGKLSLANGEVTNDFALDIVRYKKAGNTTPAAAAAAGEATYPNAVDEQGNALVPVVMPLKFSGGVTLASGALKNFGVTVPATLLDPLLKKTSLTKGLVGAFPQGALLPLTGTTDHWQFDIVKFGQENAGKALLNKVTGGSNGVNGGDGTSPADVIGDLLKKKKKKPANTDGN